MIYKNIIKFGLVLVSFLLLFFMTAVASDQKDSDDAEVIFQVA